MSPDFIERGIRDAHAAGLARALALLVMSLLQRNDDGTMNDSSEDAREALRGLSARVREGALSLQLDTRGLVINGQPIADTPLDVDMLIELLETRMTMHAIGTVTVRQGAAPNELMTLARLLADMPSALATTTDNALAEPGAVDRRTPVAARTGARTPHEVLRSWSVRVTPTSVPIMAGEPVTPVVSGSLSRLHAAYTDEAAVAAVDELLRLANDAIGRNDASSLEAVVSGLVAHTRFVGPGAGRLATEAALRRVLTDSAIELLASRVPRSSARDLLISALARAGETGVRVLVAQLMQAEDLDARRSYFDAIVALDAGVGQLRSALSDPRWYVVGNAAALLAEMNVVEADVDLIRLLSSTDERIRIRAARALTRLRTVRGMAALHRALPDTNAEVRRLAAASYGLAASMSGTKPPTGPLVMALNAETEEEVALEMIASLGQVGSADGVQRLVRQALNAVDSGAQRQPWFRVASLEALVVARGMAATPTLEAALRDDDVDVVQAAQRLLQKTARRS